LRINYVSAAKEL